MIFTVSFRKIPDILRISRDELAAPVAAASMESFSLATKYLSHLSSLCEVEHFSTLVSSWPDLSSLSSSSCNSAKTSPLPEEEVTTWIKKAKDLFKWWDMRYRLARPLFLTGELTLEVRLSLLSSLHSCLSALRSTPSSVLEFTAEEKARISVFLSRLARKNGFHSKASLSIETASSCLMEGTNDDAASPSLMTLRSSIYYEKMKIMWDSHKPRDDIARLLQEKREALDSNVENKILLLRARCLEETGHATTQGTKEKK